MIIGQNKITTWVDNNHDSLPHFIVLIGPKGSGKRTMAKYIAASIGAVFAECDIKVDAVREVIDYAYNSENKTVFCFANADTMRSEAKNAMLKITEEPPTNAYIILTVIDESTLLDTIKSRASVWILEPYTQKDIEFFATHSQFHKDNMYLLGIAQTPYELIQLVKYGNEFINYVNLVIDNIGEVESANAFKSGTKLALKSDVEGYDLGLFWRTFIVLCENRIKDDPLHYAEGIVVTDKYYRKQSQLGVNLQQVYDAWVFEIREVWA